DDAFEPPLRVRIRGRSDREPFGERAEPLLRQRELDVDGIERLQRDDRRALREEIADADAPDADLARERRPHDLLRYRGPDAVDSCRRLLPLGLGAVEVRLRHRTIRDETPRPLEREARKPFARFGRAQLALLELVVEPHELLTRLDVRAGLEADRTD